MKILNVICGYFSHFVCENLGLLVKMARDKFWCWQTISKINVSFKLYLCMIYYIHLCRQSSIICHRRLLLTSKITSFLSHFFPIFRHKNATNKPIKFRAIFRNLYHLLKIKLYLTLISSFFF